jgi:CRP-like cAMP-binding protein
MAAGKHAEEAGDRPNGLTPFETRLVNLLGMLLVRDKKQTEQITLLNQVGFRPVEIAALLGTTPNTVNVELSNQRRQKKVKSGRKGK